LVVPEWLKILQIYTCFLIYLFALLKITDGPNFSAIAVRYLTGRFIGEYASGTEITYQHVVNYFSKRTNTVNLVDTTSVTLTLLTVYHVKHLDNYSSISSTDERKWLVFTAQSSNCFPCRLLYNWQRIVKASWTNSGQLTHFCTKTSTSQQNGLGTSTSCTLYFIIHKYPLRLSRQYT